MKKAQKLVVGNWKMNPENLSEAKKIFQGVKRGISKSSRAEVVICPPSIYFGALKSFYGGKKISFGFQNVFFEKRGAFTGEISAQMAKNAGSEYVILGHSERRAMGEADEDVSCKVKSVLQVGMTPIICIGENERDQEGNYLSLLSSQIRASLAGVSKKDINGFVIAYEPVWAIGEKAKGAMEPRDIHETVLFLRKILADMFGKKEAMQMKIIYGGSVDENNAAAIIKDGDVSGFLVGRASLDPKKFTEIINAIS